jgi:hypothetical protein
MEDKANRSFLRPVAWIPAIITVILILVRENHLGDLLIVVLLAASVTAVLGAIIARRLRFATTSNVVIAVIGLGIEIPSLIAGHFCFGMFCGVFSGIVAATAELETSTLDGEIARIGWRALVIAVILALQLIGIIGIERILD